MSNKTSDKNVANIEEDVKILEEFAEICKAGLACYDQTREGKALEHILAEREQIISWWNKQDFWTDAVKIGDKVTFFNNLNIIGVTNRKLPAQMYIDDRAYKYTGQSVKQFILDNSTEEQSMEIKTKYEIGQRVWIVYEHQAEACVYDDYIEEACVNKDELFYILKEACIDVKEEDIVLYEETDKLVEKIKQTMEKIREREENK